MLEELTIRNYALIDSLSVRFPDGFCVLSGETGAGKSILVGALSLILGAKADQDVIRTGKDEAEVSGVIKINGNREAENWLRERDITAEEGFVVLRRIIKRTGRGGVYIQSTPVTLGDLQIFTSFLVDLHGQHEHQSLFSLDNHRKYLDRYGGLSDRLDGFLQKFTILAELKKNYENLTASEKERSREYDLLSYAVEEIDKAGILPGEEEALIKERKILIEHEKLQSLVQESLEAFSDSKGSVLGLLRRGLNALSGAAAIDESLSVDVTRLENSYFELEDAIETIKKYDAGESFNPERLEYCEERLAVLHRLGKKYGPAVEEILKYREEAKSKIEGIENFSDEKRKYEEKIRELEQTLLSEAGTFSEQRNKTAIRLEGEIEEALKSLGMKKIRFKVRVEKKESPNGGIICGPTGFDTVSFLISPNPGEPLKPLRSIASGGELSRVMLAVKTILAESDDIRCLIFDEIDSGIGGEVALSVGEFLHRLSRNKQVLVITHLASIAAQADCHFRVEKNVDEERTYTDIKTIEGRGRIKEIARMLSGEPNGAASLSHAEDILKKYGAL
jgi:DNA repair protein RecN (Recombination protein N)